MSAILRKLLGSYMEEETGGEGGAAAGGEEVVKEDKAPPAPSDAEMSEGMVGAIGAALKVEGIEPPAETLPIGGEKKAAAPAKAAPAAVEELAETKALKEIQKIDASKLSGAALASHQARLSAAIDAEEVAKDNKAKAAVVETEKKEKKLVEGKTLKDFVLSPEEKKALGQKAQERFHGLHVFAKTQQQAAETANAKVAELTQTASMADQLLDTMEAHGCTPQHLTSLLKYNKLVTTGDYKGALRFLDNTRAAILAELGEEGPGVDLLKDHPDLVEKVELGEMTRASALEVVKARRTVARQQNQQNNQQQTQRQQEEETRVREGAMSSIETWCKKMKGSDVDYMAKERRIMPQVPEIVKGYPPNLWLPTFQKLYAGIEIVRQQRLDTSGEQPLRPTGSKGGAKAPATMEEALGNALNVNMT